MIYGVTIILNDCNFSLKNRAKKVVERYSFEAFYTTKQAALDTYFYQVNKVLSEKGIKISKYELRGRCEVYKCNISDSRILNHGTIINEHKI